MNVLQVQTQCILLGSNMTNYVLILNLVLQNLIFHSVCNLLFLILFLQSNTFFFLFLLVAKKVLFYLFFLLKVFLLLQLKNKLICVLVRKFIISDKSFCISFKFSVGSPIIKSTLIFLNPIFLARLYPLQKCTIIVDSSY